MVLGLEPMTRLPLSLGHFVLADLEGLGDLNAMGGFFIRRAVVVAGGAAHDEFAGSDLDELHADAVFTGTLTEEGKAGQQGNPQTELHAVT